MRPLRPACGTVLNAQLLTLPDTIRISAPGVVTTQLSPEPPASSSATEVLGSSESRLATAQPPPTTTKSNVSVTPVSPLKTFVGSNLCRHCERSEAIHGAASGKMDCFAALAMTIWMGPCFRRDDDNYFSRNARISWS